MGFTTYFLGAGASFEVLPIYANFSEKLRFVISKLTTLNVQFSDEYALDVMKGSKMVGNAISLLNLLIPAEQKSSVDTYAKSYFDRGDIENYVKIKNAITLFFELHQFFSENEYPKRYDKLIATIFDSRVKKFKKNFQIISWNYDNEIEKAIANYLSISEVDQFVNVIHRLDAESSFNPDLLNIIKLNGSCGFMDAENNIIPGIGACGYGNYKETLAKHNLIKHLEIFFKMCEIHEPAISYGWEEFNSKFYKNAKKLVNDSDSVIVIGYTFPDFNNEIDKNVLITNLRQDAKLIVQDNMPIVPIARIREMITSYCLHIWGEIPSKSDVSSFYIPAL